MPPCIHKSDRRFAVLDSSLRLVLLLECRLCWTFFVAITESAGMVLENDAIVQIELMASLFYLLKAGDDVSNNVVILSQ